MSGNSELASPLSRVPSYHSAAQLDEVPRSRIGAGLHGPISASAGSNGHGSQIPSEYTNSSSSSQNPSTAPSPISTTPSTTSLALPPVALAWALEADPPSYQASVPAGPVTYGLSAAGPNVMLVTPPEDATGALPLYHISISMDVLSPRTLVTTIRRGGTLDGPFVAEFEARQTPARVKIPDERVYMRDRDHLLQDALKKSRTQIRAETYGWQLARDDIIWERKMSLSERGSYTGYIVRDLQQIKVAQVRKAPSRRLPGSRYRQTHLLEVTPEGHAIFDDLLVSLLIIEQQANLH